MKHIDIINWQGYSLTLWLPETTPIDKIKHVIKSLKRKIRHLLPSRKIYTYGTNGLVYFDNRTKKEKFNDWLCDHIFDRPRKIRGRIRGLANIYNFLSFYDDANARMVTRMDDIKDMERSGQVFMTHREAENEYKRIKKYNDEAFNKKSKELMKEKLLKVQQGYKYSEQFRNAEKFSQEALHRHLREA
jgi:hypothetical protein